MKTLDGLARVELHMPADMCSKSRFLLCLCPACLLLLCELATLLAGYNIALASQSCP